MNRSMIRAAWVLIAIAGVLSACSFSLGADRADAQAVHDDLAARLTEAQQAQTQALALWDRLIVGEMVSCEDAISVPALVALSSSELGVHAQAATLQELLNTAINDLRASADLWDTECAQIRESVPLATARDGRAAALNAAQPLGTAAALLASWD